MSKIRIDRGCIFEAVLIGVCFAALLISVRLNDSGDISDSQLTVVSSILGIIVSTSILVLGALAFTESPSERYRRKHGGDE